MNEQPFKILINGILDLHTFKPDDISTLVPDYLDACIKKNIYQVRIIHGKGKGILRRSVLSILKKQDNVLSFKTAEPNTGGWGATVVDLKKSLKTRRR